MEVYKMSATKDEACDCTGIEDERMIISAVEPAVASPASGREGQPCPSCLRCKCKQEIGALNPNDLQPTEEGKPALKITE
jgi:hypothetical protein